MPKVVVLDFAEYNYQQMRDKIGQTLIDHFDFNSLLIAGDRILLKPNMLMASSSEEAIVTHPIFLEAVGSIFAKLGFSVSIADSPGGFAINRQIENMYKECGYKDVAEKHGFNLLYPERSFIRGGVPLCWWAEGNYKMINLAKIKTHELVTLTLAVKNLYGCISGLQKCHLHLEYPKSTDFVEIMFKLNHLIKPTLNIVDGVVGLEGNGPAKKGIPRKLGMVVIGDDPIYTDLVISRLLGLKDEAHPFIKAAKERGLINEEELSVIYETPRKPLNDFRFPGPSGLDNAPQALKDLLKALVKFWPKVIKSKCTGCNACVLVCPKKAIKLENKKAVINYRECIRCLCCSEMCKFGAIGMKKSLLVAFITFILKLAKGKKK